MVNGKTDTTSTAGRLRSKLLQYAPSLDRNEPKVQTMIILNREASQALDALRHRYKMSKGDFLTSAAGLFIMEFERVYGRPLPLDPCALAELPKETAELIYGTVADFRESMKFSNLATLPVQGLLSRSADTKLGHIAFLLRFACRGRTSKREILSFASTQLLDEILELTGPIDASPSSTSAMLATSEDG